jgi:glycosyltransferase involved in cell wall biosynthesis
MKVVTVVTQLEAGGAQVAALRLAAGLRARGHEAETWFLYVKRPAFPDARGVRVITARRPAGPVDFLRMVGALLRALRRARPDAVVSFTHYANVIVQPAARALGVPVRVASQRNPASSLPRAARRLDRLLGRGGWYSANVAVSEDTRASFRRYPEAYRRRMEVIYNGVAPPTAIGSPRGKSRDEVRAEAREAARARLGLPRDVQLLTAVGRLALQKNHALLFHALVPLKGAHLALAGAGELEQELRALARELAVEERVHFLGELDREGVAELLHASDLFLMPSRFEGLSNALLEALSAGLPIIASDIPANREVLQAVDGTRAGCLLSPDDAAAWASRIRHFLHDPGVAAELGTRARRRAEFFTEERMIAAFEALLLAAGADR